MHVGRTVGRYLAGTLVVAIVITAGLLVRIAADARPGSVSQADAIIVLGAAQYNGTPSAVFRERLDHAAELYRDGAARRIITTGGGQPGDAMSEGEAGARYLVGVGVPESSVHATTTGIDTLISLRAAATLARERGWGTVILVTDPWHMARSRAIARDLGLTVQTSPVTSGPAVDGAVRARYVARELAGLLFYRLIGGSSGSGSAVL
jgi:uncharacterized SAM-binding protein YcdF (DUF218 family)